MGEAKSAATVTRLEDAEDTDAEEEMISEEGWQWPKMQVWIEQCLASHYPICKDAIAEFGLMHRLDAETSGVLLCAKSYMGAYWINMHWNAHDITKEYIALVNGWVDPSVTEIRKRICVDKKKV